MSGKEQKYKDISHLLLKREKEHPFNMGSVVPFDSIEVGDTVEVKTSKEKLSITVDVESVYTNSIQGQIVNIHGDEPQGLQDGKKVEILNEYVLCIYRKK